MIQQQTTNQRNEKMKKPITEMTADDIINAVYAKARIKKAEADDITLKLKETVAQLQDEFAKLYGDRVKKAISVGNATLGIAFRVNDNAYLDTSKHFTNGVSHRCGFTLSGHTLAEMYRPYPHTITAWGIEGDDSDPTVLFDGYKWAIGPWLADLPWQNIKRYLERMLEGYPAWEEEFYKVIQNYFNK